MSLFYFVNDIFFYISNILHTRNFISLLMLSVKVTYCEKSLSIDSMPVSATHHLKLLRILELKISSKNKIL